MNKFKHPTKSTPTFTEISLKSLLQVGGHYGSKNSTWNPKMADYIFGSRNDIYIIDLESTVSLWNIARKAIVENAAAGGEILFIGTRKNAKEIVKEQAERCGSPYIECRSLGGTITNFDTIKSSIRKLDQLENLIARAELNDGVDLKKREILSLQKEVDRLIKKFGGIRKMRELPQLVFFVDPGKDNLLVKECRKLHLPMVAMCDTDNDPSAITHPIPVNNDSTNCIKLFTTMVAEAVLEGKEMFRQKQVEMQKHMEELVPDVLPEKEVEPEVKAAEIKLYGHTEKSKFEVVIKS